MTGTAEYRVLARKYRPSTFAELIGHDTLVRTLNNAFDSGRIAHAFMLTGVRGVGKTTTARIIARALNCIGLDGKGGPTLTPCGQCDPCRAIADDRHPDVIEMDAASRTGIDDIRELIEGVRYRPVSARYKIYIIDEVHMLSKPAFNALLKTLEEPPPDIKFVFATTEINKVPVTVLSRCQRYTLPRIPAETLAKYYGEISEKEGVAIDAAALALIARAADGSVRDGLSILDQAIALSMGATITDHAVRDMLGVADRGLTFDLYEAVMGGDAPGALAQLESLYNGGADPVMVLQDLLDITHFLTRLKLERPNDAATAAVPLADGQDRRRGQVLADRLGIAILARSWQMLLKGIGEVQMAAQPLKAAEMVLIRLIYVTDLPPPADIVKAVRGGAGTPSAGGTGSTDRGGPGTRSMAVVNGRGAAVQVRPAMTIGDPAPSDLPRPASFAGLMELIAAQREGILYSQIASGVHLVRYEVGQIEFRPAADAPRDLATKLGRFLHEATGLRWLISVSKTEGEPTLRQQAERREKQLRADMTAHPLVQAALAAFPGAAIDKIVELDLPPTAIPAELPPVAEDEPPSTLYEDEDPGPFDGGGDNIWDIDEDQGDDR